LLATWQRVYRLHCWLCTEESALLPVDTRWAVIAAPAPVDAGAVPVFAADAE
jgi:hypothetical protein